MYCQHLCSLVALLSPPSSWRGVSAKPLIKKPLWRRKSAWTVLLLILSLTLLNACVTAISSVAGAGASMTGAYFDYLTSEKTDPIIVTPRLENYSDEFQALAANELGSRNAPCSRDVIVVGCSAISRLVMDYGTLRKRIRAAKEKN